MTGKAMVMVMVSAMVMRVSVRMRVRVLSHLATARPQVSASLLSSFSWDLVHLAGGHLNPHAKGLLPVAIELRKQVQPNSNLPSPT